MSATAWLQAFLIKCYPFRLGTAYRTENNGETDEQHSRRKPFLPRRVFRTQSLARSGAAARNKTSPSSEQETDGQDLLYAHTPRYHYTQAQGHGPCHRYGISRRQRLVPLQLAIMDASDSVSVPRGTRGTVGVSSARSPANAVTAKTNSIAIKPSSRALSVR